MTETQNITQTCNTLHISTKEELHRHFGGTIYQSDFNTDYRGKDNIHGSNIATRVESDFRWEKKLSKGKVFNYG